jgi:F0F1-type ATP synthase assembly protein I
MPGKSPKNRPELALLVKLLNLGSIILVLGLLGIWLDLKLHTIPLYTIIGIVLGVLFSFYEAWRIYHKQD